MVVRSSLNLTPTLFGSNYRRRPFLLPPSSVGGLRCSRCEGGEISGLRRGGDDVDVGVRV